MSELNPYELLGVKEDASFEEIQKAKKKLKDKYENNPQQLENIEVAYDAIIMQRLRLRQEGKIKVPEQIRFPEKTVEPKKVTVISNAQKKANISLWFNNLIDQPSGKEILINSSIFLVLIVISIFNNSSETLPLLLTVGVGTGFAVLYRKQRAFWRSVGITFITFIVGICLANVIFSLSLNTGFNLSLSAEQFASLFTFCLLWLVSNFTR
ncbi:CPP1-like family protein [Cyanobacterium aponinum UTEX 3222]|uniref:Molecular chaperone DnaJ n=2 Tax=Cyanobacterium aponinum TaxID=379064 RepID=A0A844GUB0_9CHRO|nr:CPP1-like family protein [Cyanobacterium aponinum]MTF39660.1 molecular chaperone DnaJ [Cyanobacterium aponinum 0216]PHV63856.1 molecular chaperone DnaJ [Cyanobacterium aponinum IPPAS B-1201]WPF88003.1 CPP1-like family protein [Cyanobacterium aponinum AL20115]WRL43456.1 CPP1-like family protein [Cyanobacterium aponinum UTEX 3222]